jgi:hypothetical protein
MVKINLGRKLDFGKPIDLGDALYERSKVNVQLANQIILTGRTKSMKQMDAPVIAPKPLKKKIDLGKELDFGKPLNLGKELCL